jgi:hypothetical protein
MLKGINTRSSSQQQYSTLPSMTIGISMINIEAQMGKKELTSIIHEA